MEKMFGKLVWLLTSIGAINWGLEAMGWNLFQFGLFSMTMPFLIMPLKYIIGLTGIISLIMFFQDMKNPCKTCK